MRWSKILSRNHVWLLSDLARKKKVNVSLKGKKGSFRSRARRTFKEPVKSVHVAAAALLGKCFPLKSAHSTQEFNTRGRKNLKFCRQTSFSELSYRFSGGWLADRGCGGGNMGDKLVWGWECSHTAVHVRIFALICQLSAVWTATCFTEEGDSRRKQALWELLRPDGFRCRHPPHMQVWVTGTQQAEHSQSALNSTGFIMHKL